MKLIIWYAIGIIPVTTLIMVYYFFLKDKLKVWWWLFRHPETVFRVTMFFSNNTFINKYISTKEKEFKYQNGKYKIDKNAVIKQGWAGLFSSDIVYPKKTDFLGGVVQHDYSKKKAVGNLFYYYDCPEPINFHELFEKINPQISSVTIEDVAKNNLITNLLSVGFTKNVQLFLLILMIVAVIGIVLLLSIRMGYIDVGVIHCIPVAK